MAGACTFLHQHWLVMLGFAALIVPSFYTLGHESWSRESGTHGPIILATGLWLIVRAWSEVRVLMSSSSTTTHLLLIALLLSALLLYTFARAFDYLTLEMLALFGTLILVAHTFIGTRALKHLWFPILYLGFLIPIPESLLNSLTAALKADLSWAATDLLRALNYPVSREGVTIYIAQYQLLVEDACSGLNALVSLTALSLFYIYLMHRASWRHAAVLMLFVLPAALLANFVRILLLVLLTYYAGDAVAQGFLHQLAGLMMFAIALSSIFVVDAGLQRLKWWTS